MAYPMTTKSLVLAWVLLVSPTAAEPANFLSSAPQLNEVKNGTCASVECPTWYKQIGNASEVSCATNPCAEADEKECCIYWFIGFPWWAYVAATMCLLCTVICLPIIL